MLTCLGSVSTRILPYSWPGSLLTYMYADMLGRLLATRAEVRLNWMADCPGSCPNW